MAANLAPRASGAAEACAQQPLDLSQSRLPSGPLCINNAGLGGFGSVVFVCAWRIERGRRR